MIFNVDGAVSLVSFVMHSKTHWNIFVPLDNTTFEAELEDVSGHEHEQQTRRQLLIPSPLQTSEDKTRRRTNSIDTHHPSGRQLPIPGPLQSDEDVHIPRLCSPGLQTCPIQTNVEITKEHPSNRPNGERQRNPNCIRTLLRDHNHNKHGDKHGEKDEETLEVGTAPSLQNVQLPSKEKAVRPPTEEHDTEDT